MGRFSGPTYVVVDSGQTLTDPFFLGGGPDRLTILTPSRAPGATVFFQVGPSSGGPFGRIQMDTGSDRTIAVSGQAIVAGVIETMAPGVYGRIQVSAATTQPNTFTLIGGVSR